MPNKKNLNKGYFLTVDVKRSTVTIPSDFRFYITDKKTSDLYVQLLINEQPNNVIKNYVGLEEASNYRLTLNIIKPNNEPKEIKGKLIDEDNAIFYYDLSDDCKDIIGQYKCEFYIECTVNSSKEATTSDSFHYTVSPSIFNTLDEPIESDEKYPILLDLIKRIEDLGGSGGTTIAGSRIWFGEADPEPDPTKYDLWVTDESDLIDLVGSLQHEFIDTIQDLSSRLKEAEEEIALLQSGTYVPGGDTGDAINDAILLEDGLPIMLEDDTYLQLEIAVQ